MVTLPADTIFSVVGAVIAIGFAIGVVRVIVEAAIRG
jgi:phosphate/sulfate permease